ncbi:MAG TPA: ABC transporter permease [Pseudolysinimonas sp.]|jgi:molybdate transport system permease protein|nr:ABC transporter permease [Pseudolysinimonas sp.]
MSRGARPSPLIIAVACIALAFLVLPLVALVIRAPWADLPRLLISEPVAQALGLSLLTGLISTAACLVLGIPLAVLLSYSSGAARRLLRAAITVPLVLPPVVGGIALLLLLGRRGIIGQALAEAGLGIPYTTGAVVVAQTFVAMPFLVFAVEGTLSAADRRTEAAAATLGANRWQVFRLVTVPLVAPGIAAGAVLCFTRALGEFGATITFAGSLPGVTRTLPIASYLALQSDPEAAIALALLLLVVSLAVLLGLRDRWLPGVRG